MYPSKLWEGSASTTSRHLDLMSRKQRRSAATANGSAAKSEDASLKEFKITEIPFAQPDRSGPKQPTLFDIAAQREADLHKRADAMNAQRAKQRGNKSSPQGNGKISKVSEELEPPSSTTNVDAFLVSLLYGVTLTSLHLTLDIVTWHQYAQELAYGFLMKRNMITTLPLATFLVFVFHSPAFGIARYEWLRQMIFFCAAVGCGIYAVAMSNEGAFLAVMKKVPPAVTVMLWAVMEMNVMYSVISVAITGVVVWWMNWTVY